MTIYLITIFILFGFSLLEVSYTLSKRLFFFCVSIAYVLIVFQIGTRWETGTDWYPYLKHFQATNSPTFGLDLFEIGYCFMVWGLKKICSSYSFFLIVHALLYYALIFKSIIKLSNFFFLTLLLFYCFTMGYVGANRQLLAIALCFYGLQFLQEKRYKTFYLFIGIAVLFHTSAIFFFVYRFLTKSINSKVIWGVIFICIILAYFHIPIYMLKLVGSFGTQRIQMKLNDYLYVYNKVSIRETQYAWAGVIKKIMFCFLFFYTQKKLQARVTNCTLMFNGYWIGVCLFFLFSDSVPVLVNRGGMYFFFTEPFLIAYSLLLFKETSKKNFALGLLFYSVLSFYKSINSFPELFLPYKGIFINTQYVRPLIY